MLILVGSVEDATIQKPSDCTLDPGDQVKKGLRLVVEKIDAAEVRKRSLPTSQQVLLIFMKMTTMAAGRHAKTQPNVSTE